MSGPVALSSYAMCRDVALSCYVAYGLVKSQCSVLSGCVLPPCRVQFCPVLSQCTIKLCDVWFCRNVKYRGVIYVLSRCVALSRSVSYRIVLFSRTVQYCVCRVSSQGEVLSCPVLVQSPCRVVSSHVPYRRSVRFRAARNVSSCLVAVSRQVQLGPVLSQGNVTLCFVAFRRLVL